MTAGAEHCRVNAPGILYIEKASRSGRVCILIILIVCVHCISGLAIALQWVLFGADTIATHHKPPTYAQHGSFCAACDIVMPLSVLCSCSWSISRYADLMDTEGNDTERNGTGWDGTGRDGTGRDGTRRDETRRDETRRDETRRDETRRDETRRDETRRDETGRERDGRGQPTIDAAEPLRFHNHL